MKHTIARRMAVGAVTAGAVAGLVVAGPRAAFGAPSTNATAGSTTPTTQASSPRCTAALFGQAQQLVEADLAARVTQLGALAAAAGNAANHLSAGDRQTLQNDITTVELPGIQGLPNQT